METRKRIEQLLTKVNKPSRYIGQEVGSSNKDWKSASARCVLAFPDLYEIGISNLGLRILYNRINNSREGNFLADRVYAPDSDFRGELLKEQIPLYGLESFMPVSEFDLIAFSLQYELSYPTILAMLEMSGIPYKSLQRSDSHPIVIAGGPGSYNPFPISEFIDLFLLGDGETVIVEIMKIVSESKKSNLGRQDILIKLSEIQGVFIPLIHTEKDLKIKKRVDSIDDIDYPIKFPVPYSTAVHDRAVVELRRGCSRMCRFCQACFVNFPVRERSSDKVIYIVDEVLKNTGYDEYSLLSLSSNDYVGIEELIEKLNEKHSCMGVSVSLPSQRADNFSMRLANLVQSVRKSTITLAPEAGSQKLRDVINKNLTEEQVIDAVKSVYRAGWHNVKLYFMIGLPTETYNDLDEMVNLLQKIKDEAGLLKREMNLKKFLSITATVSIFVPKPFTPFQWHPQDMPEVLEEKIRYLRQKIKPIRDVKLNFHDGFLSMLEAVFSRGDKRLNSLIEAVYRKGSYLDAWSEHFNREIWLEAGIETVQEIGISLEAYACRQIPIEEQLDWDIFDIGIEKDFLAREYKKALESTVSGVEILKQSSCYAENMVQSGIDKIEITKPNETNKIISLASNDEGVFRYRMKIQKINAMRYISHLDWQKLIYSAVRKAVLKVNFTQGFNPTPKISLALALPIFIEGEAELLEIELQEDLTPEEVMRRLNFVLPQNSKILQIIKIPKHSKQIQQNISIDKAVFWAEYEATPDIFPFEENFQKIDLQGIAKNCILEDNIFIEKKSKSSKSEIKKIDIRPSIHSLRFVDAGYEDEGPGKLNFILKTGQGWDSKDGSAALRADLFLEAIAPGIGWRIVRKRLLDNNFQELISTNFAGSD